MVDSKFNNVEKKNDGFDFGIFGIKMTAFLASFRKNKNILKIALRTKFFKKRLF